MATIILCILMLLASNLLFAAEERNLIVWKEVRFTHPLFQAVENDNLSSLQQQLTAGAFPYIYDPSTQSLLHVAVSKGSKAVAQYLVENNIIPLDVQDKWGNTPLHDAARSQLVDIVNLLLAHKAPVNVQNKHGNTPLCAAYDAALYRGKRLYELVYSIINTLLEAGADPNLGSPLLVYLFVPFFLKIESERAKQRLTLLLDAGADIDCVKNGSSVISVYKKDNDIISLLLSRGANIYLAKDADIAEQIANPNCLLGAWHQAVHQLRYPYVLLGRVLPPEVVQHIFHLVYRNTHNEDTSDCNLPGKGIFKFLARTGQWGPPNKNEKHQLIFATHGIFDRMVQTQKERCGGTLPWDTLRHANAQSNGIEKKA